MAREDEDKTKNAPMLLNSAAVLAAALSLWGSVSFWRAESANANQSADPYRVADQDLRFAGLRAAVPADAVLGYLTDVSMDDTLGTAMFLTSQYSLAPRLLEKTSAAELVLGNFTRPADFSAVGREHGLRLEHDFGNGVVLFRRDTNP